MDQKSTGDASAASVHARRQRMRTEARGLRSATPRSAQFQTPKWLDHSFVLPLTAPQAVAVPRQSVPHHDDTEHVESPVSVPEDVALSVAVSVSHGEAQPAFVRPPTTEIDFAQVMRRSDLIRTSLRIAIATGVIAVLVLLAYLLTSSATALGMAVVLGLVALGAAGMRIRLTTAPIPYLDDH